MVNVVTLDEVRAHLRYPIADTQDDASMQLYIDAADQALAKECGDLIPTTYDETHDGGSTAIYTYHKPILSVESIEEGWGFANYILDYVQSDSVVSSGSLYSYSIDQASTGQITRRTAGNVLTRFVPGTSNIRITYTAGRTPVPAIIRLAELELIAFWWQNSQQRVSQQATASGFGAMNEDFPRSGTDSYTPINQGIPWRIIEMIKAYRADPIIG